MFFQLCFAQKYKVIDIDSTENNYIITIRKCLTKKIIVSSIKHFPLNEGRTIIIKGKRYDFELEEYENARFVNMVNYYEFSIEGKTIWNSRKKFNIFTSKSLRGLHYFEIE